MSVRTEIFDFSQVGDAVHTQSVVALVDPRFNRIFGDGSLAYSCMFFDAPFEFAADV